MTRKYIEIIQDTRDQLNKVGKGFCLAKWNMETLYLHMGDNHSCYHPRPHHIGLDEIAVDPSALHNTKWKKEQRKSKEELWRHCHAQHRDWNGRPRRHLWSYLYCAR